MVKIFHKKAAISFTSGTSDDFIKKIKRLDTKKTTLESDIPTKVMKKLITRPHILLFRKKKQ